MRFFAIIFTIVLGLFNVSFESLASEGPLDGILAPEKRLCGSAQVGPDDQIDQDMFQFKLSSGPSGQTWTIQTQADTYSQLLKVLGNTANHVVVCILVDDLDKLDPSKPLYAPWFAAWDISGSGVTVSN